MIRSGFLSVLAHQYTLVIGIVVYTLMYADESKNREKNRICVCFLPSVQSQSGLICLFYLFHRTIYSYAVLLVVVVVVVAVGSMSAFVEKSTL